MVKEEGSGQQHTYILRVQNSENVRNQGGIFCTISCTMQQKSLWKQEKKIHSYNSSNIFVVKWLIIGTKGVRKWGVTNWNNINHVKTHNKCIKVSSLVIKRKEHLLFSLPPHFMICSVLEEEAGISKPGHWACRYGCSEEGQIPSGQACRLHKKEACSNWVWAKS